jgi:hypothetical protein
MVLGICLFFSPITKLIGFIPLVGGIISGIVGFAIFLAALLICIPLYILFTAIAWLFYHPKVGIIILLVGGAILTAILLWNSSNGGGGNSNQNVSSHYSTGITMRSSIHE